VLLTSRDKHCPHCHSNADSNINMTTPRNIPQGCSRETLEIPRKSFGNCNISYSPGWFGYIFKVFRHISNILGPYGSRKCRTSSNHTNLTRRIDPRSPEASVTPISWIFRIFDFQVQPRGTQLAGDRDLSPVSRGQKVLNHPPAVRYD